MNTLRPAASRNRSSLVHLSARSRALLFGLLIGSPAYAAVFYWDNSSGSNASGNVLNWATTLAGGTDPAAAPNNLADEWYFSAATVASAQTMGLNGSRSVLGITFASTFTTNIENHTSNGSTNTLTIGSGGITVNSGAGAVALGSNSGTRGFMNYRLNESQSWTNNSANLLTVTGSITNGSSVTPANLTLAGSSPAGITIVNALGDGGGAGSTSLTINNTGGGVTTLTAANTHTGATRLRSGALRLGNSASLQNSTVELAAGDTGTLNFGTLTAATFGALTGARDVVLTNTNATPAGVALTVGGNNSDQAYSGSLGGAGSLIKTGSGTLTLSGNNSYAGNTTVNGGTLVLDKSNGVGALSSGALSLGGGRLIVKGTAVGSTAQSFGALSLAVGSTNKIVLDSNGGAGTALTLANSAPTRANASTLLIDLTSPNSSLISTLGLADGAQAANAPILGYALVADPVGTGFATNVGGNIVRYTGASELSDTSNDGAVNFKITAAGTSSAAAPLLTTAENPLYNSLSIDTSAASGPNYLSLNGTATITSRAILMTGANHFTISGGTSLGASGNEVVLHNAGTGTLTIRSNILTSAAPVSKSGPGTVVLGGANSHANATRINEGILRLGATGGATNTPLGTNAQGTFVQSGGALDLGGYTLGTAEALTLNGTGVAGGGALMNSGGAATYSGLVTLGSASSIVAAGNITLSSTGVITGSGFGLTLGGSATGSVIAGNINTAGGGVTKTGSGAWMISGSSTYTGQTNINQGVLELGAGNFTSTVLVSSVTSGQRTVGVASTTGLVAGQSVTGTGIPTGTVISSVDSPTQITVSAGATATNASANLTFGAYSPLGVGGAVSFTGGVLRYGAGIATDYSARLKNSTGAISIDTNGNAVAYASVIDASNTGGLAKQGLGRLALNGASTFTGDTKVLGGSLGGTGSVLSSVVVEPGAALSPGGAAGAVGTFTIAGSLTLKAGSALDLDLAAPGTSDLLVVVGGIGSTGVSTVNLNGLSGFGAGIYTLISGSAPLSPASFAVGAIPAGYRGVFSSVGNSLVLEVSEAPALSALETWRATNFGASANSGDGADGADPDGDGLINLVEYATGTNPQAANASAVAVGRSGGSLALTYTRVADATLTYTVEGSDDLAAWSTVTTANNPSTGAQNLAGQVTVIDTATLTSRRFLRLKVSY